MLHTFFLPNKGLKNIAEESAMRELDKERTRYTTVADARSARKCEMKQSKKTRKIIHLVAWRFHDITAIL